MLTKNLNWNYSLILKRIAFCSILAIVAGCSTKADILGTRALDESVQPKSIVREDQQESGEPPSKLNIAYIVLDDSGFGPRKFWIRN